MFRVQLEGVLIEGNGSNLFFSRVGIYSQKYTIRLIDSNILKFNMYSRKYLLLTCFFGRIIVLGY